MLLTRWPHSNTIAANSDHFDIGQRHHSRCHWSAKHWTTSTNCIESSQRTTIKDNRFVKTSEIFTDALKALSQTPSAYAYYWCGRCWRCNVKVNGFVYNSCHSVATTTARIIVYSRFDNRNCINTKSKCRISDKTVITLRVLWSMCAVCLTLWRFACLSSVSEWSWFI